MNKQDLIDEIAARGALNKAQASQALDALGGIAQAHLIMPGTELTLPGIGKLKAVAKPARTGRNPATGEEIKIAAKTAVKFTAAKALKDAVA
ncbi:MAG: HU family DNA-binding protein [Betaproteobacteria bacterium]|nr:HU family DNA-binding protein [Betaproteobacteria bacterium]